VSEPLVLRPGALGDDPGAVTRELTGAFVAAREALASGRPVAIVVAAGDLLGQGSPLDAAVATGLLGMVRTLAIEGAKPGWRINVVAAEGVAAGAGAGDDGDGARAGDDAAGKVDAVAETVALLADSSLTGQLLQVGAANLGKLPA
jgi:NAD(P)-dependent dehydrogenase (short-subunit alcohol dehydrogenase family)